RDFHVTGVQTCALPIFLTPTVYSVPISSAPESVMCSDLSVAPTLTETTSAGGSIITFPGGTSSARSFSLYSINSEPDPIAVTATMCGPVASGLAAKTEFCLPGVPPSGASDSLQLSSSPQGLPGSISSSDQPPSRLEAFRYHVFS